MTWQVLADQKAGALSSLGRFRADGGATHRALDLDSSVAYVDQVFDDYLAYGGLGPADLAGRRVLEVGPGDSPGVALRLLAAGAAQVVCLDRFVSIRDERQQRAIVSAIVARLDEEQQERLAGLVLPTGGLDEADRRLRFVEGQAIEEAHQRWEAGSVDLILSRAVMEHVYDPDAALKAMDRLLAAGGTMLHKIDFRDHGMFSEHGHHPLTLLTIPERLFRWTGQRSGGLNRRRLDYYRQKMEELGYEVHFFTSHIVGVQ